MSLIQALLIALFGYLGSIYGTFLFGTVGGWNLIGRPIVAGAIIGVIMGDVTNGILIGAAIQALYVGLVTPGMSVPGDVNFASYIGIPLALAAGASPEYAVGISVPLSLLGVAAIYSVATFNAVFVHLQEKWISEGKLKHATRIPIYSNISEFIVRFVPIFLACYFGADYVPTLIALIPEWLPSRLLLHLSPMSIISVPISPRRSNRHGKALEIRCSQVLRQLDNVLIGLPEHGAHDGSRVCTHDGARRQEAV